MRDLAVWDKRKVLERLAGEADVERAPTTWVLLTLVPALKLAAVPSVKEVDRGIVNDHVTALPSGLPVRSVTLPDTVTV